MWLDFNWDICQNKARFCSCHQKCIVVFILFLFFLFFFFSSFFLILLSSFFLPSFFLSAFIPSFPNSLPPFFPSYINTLDATLSRLSCPTCRQEMGQKGNNSQAIDLWETQLKWRCHLLLRPSLSSDLQKGCCASPSPVCGESGTFALIHRVPRRWDWTTCARIPSERGQQGTVWHNSCLTMSFPLLCPELS